MQNRYVGDIGDYIKYSFLNAISVDRTLAVIWFLTDNETHNNDGKHTDYLENKRKKFEKFDPELFKKLKKLVDNKKRNVVSVRIENLLKNGIFFFEEKIINYKGHAKINSAREIWFEDVIKACESAEIIFLDPDNGIEPETFNENGKKSIKSVRLNEIKKLLELYPEKTILFYHHQTRFKGGHEKEIEHILAKIKKLETKQKNSRLIAVRAKPYSPRVFFVITTDKKLEENIKRFCSHWAPHIRIFDKEIY